MSLSVFQYSLFNNVNQVNVSLPNIFTSMTMNDVKENSEAQAMCFINKSFQFVRCPVPGGGGKETGHLH